MELFLAIYAARSSDPRTKINSSVIISYEWINLLFYFTISWTCFYEFKLFLLDRRTRLFLFLFLFLNSYRTFKWFDSHAYRTLSVRCMARFDRTFDRYLFDVSYLARQKTGCRRSIVRIRFWNRFVDVLHMHARPSDPNSISTYYDRCDCSYETTGAGRVQSQNYEKKRKRIKERNCATVNDSSAYYLLIDKTVAEMRDER